MNEAAGGLLVMLGFLIGVPTLIFVFTYGLYFVGNRGAKLITQLEDTPSNDSSGSLPGSTLKFESKNLRLYYRLIGISSVLLYVDYIFFYKRNGGDLTLALLAAVLFYSIYKVSSIINEPSPITLSPEGFTFSQLVSSKFISWDSVDNILFTIDKLKDGNFSTQNFRITLKSGEELILYPRRYKNHRDFRKQFELYAKRQGVNVTVEDLGL